MRRILTTVADRAHLRRPSDRRVGVAGRGEPGQEDVSGRARAQAPGLDLDERNQEAGTDPRRARLATAKYATDLEAARRTATPST